MPDVFWMPDRIVRSKKYKAYEIAVFAVLCSHAQTNGEWAMSMRQIAEEAGTSESSARRAIRRFESEKLIETIRRGTEGEQWRNAYRVLNSRSGGQTPLSGRPRDSVSLTDVGKSQGLTATPVTNRSATAARAASASPPDDTTDTWTDPSKPWVDHNPLHSERNYGDDEKF